MGRRERRGVSVMFRCGALKRIHVDQYGTDRLAPDDITREGARLVDRSVHEGFYHAWKDKKHSLRLVEAVSLLVGA